MQEKKLVKINPLHSTEGHFKSIKETLTAGNPVRFPRKGSKPPSLSGSQHHLGGEVPSSHGDSGSDMSEPEDRTLWRNMLKRPGGKQKKQEQRRAT